MATIRSIVHSRSFLMPALITIALSLAVIVGLLAMHTLSTHDVGPGSHSPHAAAASDAVAGPMTGHVDASDDQPCDCASPAPTQDHSTMTTACLLALLVTLLLVAAPTAFRGRRDWTRRLMTLPQWASRALPRARPPSLLVLSISRT